MHSGEKSCSTNTFLSELNCVRVEKVHAVCRVQHKVCRECAVCSELVHSDTFIGAHLRVCPLCPPVRPVSWSSSFLCPSSSYQFCFNLAFFDQDFQVQCNPSMQTYAEKEQYKWVHHQKWNLTCVRYLTDQEWTLTRAAHTYFPLRVTCYASILFLCFVIFFLTTFHTKFNVLFWVTALSETFQSAYLFPFSCSLFVFICFHCSVFSSVMSLCLQLLAKMKIRRLCGIKRQHARSLPRHQRTLRVLFMLSVFMHFYIKTSQELRRCPVSLIVR